MCADLMISKTDDTMLPEIKVVWRIFYDQSMSPCLWFIPLYIRSMPHHPSTGNKEQHCGFFLL